MQHTDHITRTTMPSRLSACRTILLALALLTGAQTANAQNPPATNNDPALAAELAKIAAAHHGRVALFAEQLNTGHTVGLNPDAVVQTASIIKLTILFEAMEQVRSGKARW